MSVAGNHGTQDGHQLHGADVFHADYAGHQLLGGDVRKATDVLSRLLGVALLDYLDDALTRNRRKKP